MRLKGIFNMVKLVDTVRHQNLPMNGALIATGYDSSWSTTTFKLESPGMDLGEFRGIYQTRVAAVGYWLPIPW